MTNETQTQIKIFNNDTFGQLRVILINDEPMFLGKEVALLLGYNDTDQSLRKNVDDEDKIKAPVPTTGGSQVAVLINESGLYSLILRSKLDSAKPFKRWVTSDVLPSIRKTGKFEIIKKSTLEVAASMTADQLEVLLIETKAKEKAQKELELAKPKIEFFNNINSSITTWLVRDFAKMIGIKEKSFREWLRTEGYITKGNQPTSLSVQSGFLAVKLGSFVNNSGDSIATQTTIITSRGVTHFANKLARSGVIDKQSLEQLQEKMIAFAKNIK